MALFRQTGARQSGARGSVRGARKSEPRTAHREPRTGLRAALRFLGWLVFGIAVMAGVGYLVAAIWLFPSPLFSNDRMVPRVVGLTEREATRQLERAKFRIGTETERHIVSGRGTVVWQDPPPGMRVRKGSEVRLTVSSGPPMATIPRIDGMDLELAVRVLGAVGLRVEGVDTVVVKARTPGTATGTEPQAGDSVPVGRGIIVHLAR